jgi:hypothetical protein
VGHGLSIIDWIVLGIIAWVVALYWIMRFFDRAARLRDNDDE